MAKATDTMSQQQQIVTREGVGVAIKSSSRRRLLLLIAHVNKNNNNK